MSLMDFSLTGLINELKAVVYYEPPHYLFRYNDCGLIIIENENNETITIEGDYHE